MKITQYTLRRAPMYRFAALCLIAVLVLTGCDSDGNAEDPVERELDQVRQATETFQNINAAMDAGYTVQATEHRAGMGIHYLNPDLLDDTFEVTKPEILMYVEQADGSMTFVGVEYATPVDLTDPGPAPEGFTGDTDVWVINQEFSLWTLHAWTVLDNPNGVFSPTNPQVP